ncbi:Cytochrome P450 2L1 [Chionoecetes opilio]|uniref:Cytochrome P450 2L1 n=1 Tax=Chionoecetes opilio TaxID=41210 RepID=A0A8J4Y4E6_CHIOP|nr:Cytochrome P450 2L1 [Chionoecetes opilio]
MLVEVLLFAGLLFLLWKSFKKPSGLPPGRWGVPLLGYIPFTTKSIEEQVTELHKKHGDIILWRMGTQSMVFLNSYKLVREAFSRSEISDRPDWETFKFFEDPAVGIGSSNGTLWHNNRRFALRQLRDLGMGKSKLVETVQQQTLILRETLAKTAGTPGEMPHQLHVSIINIIWQMVANRHFDAQDKRLKGFVKHMDDFVVLSNRLAFKDFMPWLQNIMPDFLFKILIKHHDMVAMKEKFFGYFHEEIQQHRATLDPDNPRDVIDGYLIEMESQKDDPESTCSDNDLAFLVFDLFFAGSETTVNTFIWMCYYLAAHPHVQRKLHAEIDEVLPDGVLASLAEKSRMPYTEAVANEVLRISTLVNFGIQHMASADTQLGGYSIPKGTIVSSNVYAVHEDDNNWNRPLDFLPERWLGEDGKFTMKKEGFLPFGVGKRVCVGESLARMELFILTTVIFQSFTVAPPPGKTINLVPDLSSFFFRKPKYNELVFTERK